MTELYKSDDDLVALSGTTGDAGEVYQAQNENPHSVANYRWEDQVGRLMIPMSAFQVFKDGDLTYGVRGGQFINVDATVVYTASAGNALTNNATNYVFIVRDGTLTINTTGFPTPGVTPHVPLAEIVTAAGNYDVTDITDRRVRSLFTLVGVQAFDDVRVSLLRVNIGGANAPDIATWLDNGAGSQGVSASHFDAAAEEELSFTAELPHTYKEGSDIDAHIHWVPTANGGAGQVVSWGLEYSIQKRGGVFANTTIVSGNTHAPVADPLVDNTHMTTDLAMISGTGLTVSTIIVGRIFRDATGALKTDDFAADAIGLNLDFHYEVDAHGSQDEDDKL